MPKKLHQSTLRVASRLLTTGEAANYCRLSIPTFKRLCPVIPVKLGEGKRAIVRYDLQSLDDWIDRLNQSDSSSVSLSPAAALERMRQEHGHAGPRERN